MHCQQNFKFKSNIIISLYKFQFSRIIEKLNIYFNVKLFHTALVMSSSGFHRPSRDLTNTIIHYLPPNGLEYGGNKSC
jgi:hypothetical protein